VKTNCAKVALQVHPSSFVIRYGTAALLSLTIGEKGGGTYGASARGKRGENCRRRLAYRRLRVLEIGA
jgi:hypothetical protein